MKTWHSPFCDWAGSVSGQGDHWRIKTKKSKQKFPPPKRVLAVPDLDYAKTAVLNTLSSADSRRSYSFRHRGSSDLVLLRTKARLWQDGSSCDTGWSWKAETWLLDD